MKKSFQYILIIILFSLWGIILTNKPQAREYFQDLTGINKPCTKPIEYSIGSIDPRFGISDSDFINTISEAEKVWEIPSGKNLFQYNTGATFRINLVYDSRQEQTMESKKLEDQLGQLESSHDVLTDEYNSSSAAYRKRIDVYNVALAKYKDKLSSYSSEVESWNSQGGAPSDVYDKLKKEKKELDSQFAELEKERIAINKLAGRTNDLAQKSNQIADTYNQNLNTYKDRFGGSVQFDKGVYDGQKIDIFQFYEIADLRLTLAHELGHALDIGHLENSKSVMYYLMGDQNMDDPQATEEDINALRSVCRIN